MPACGQLPAVAPNASRRGVIERSWTSIRCDSCNSAIVVQFGTSKRAGCDRLRPNQVRGTCPNLGRLVFVSFLIGISEVTAGPGCPTAHSTAAVAPDVPQNGKRTDLPVPTALVTLSERQRPEPRLRCSASVCIVPDRYSGGCFRATAPQRPQHRRSRS